MRGLLPHGLLGCVAVLTVSADANAQFVGGGFAVPGVSTPGVYMFYRKSYGFSVGSGLGPGVSFGYTLSGPVGYGINRMWYNNNRSTFLGTPTYSGYMTGGVRPNQAAALDFARAQRQAAMQWNPASARSAIHDQWAYEKLGAIGLPDAKPGDDVSAALVKAISNASEAEIASGEALNHIVVGIVAAEKNGKAGSAFLPPNLLQTLRFAGPPAADAINLIRQVGKVEFPAAFDNPAFGAVKPVLDRDLAAAAAPVLLGKPADTAKVLQLGNDAVRARAILDPITRDLEFEDATAARRFLNQLDGTVAALKGANTSGLIDPRWATEGTSVADLVKHVAKYKLLFGPAPKGDEEAYAALHRGLAAYLVALQDSQKPAPKK